MGLLSDELIADIRGRTDIVQVVEEYVRLVPSGRTFKGLCPFHQEKTPSFYVVPDKQIFHCFGCGRGGSVFKFLMEIDRLSFPESVKFLARRCGVVIPTAPDPEAEQKNELFGILEEAAGFFTAQLADFQGGRDVRSYLSARSLTPETVRRFRMGFAPDAWDSLLTRLGTSSARVALLEKAGLIKARPRKNPGDAHPGYYDTFRHRLIIPILDIQGRIVGFGGRVIDKGEEPKYLNSPETEVFNKRKMLFNFREALNPIRQQNSAIVVEGYLDVISLVQAGIENAVASLGTAVTPEQINLIARNCGTVFFSYDADEAGQKATVRAISLHRDTPLNARVISFNDSKDDPDSFIRREGREAFLRLLESARDIYSFLIDIRTRGLKQPLEIHVKEKLIQEFKDLFPAIQSPIAKSEMIKTISRLLDMEPGLLESQFSARGLEDAPPRPRSDPRAASSLDGQRLRLEEWILKYLLERPEEIERARSLLGPTDFSDPRLQKIYGLICSKQEKSEGSLKASQILAGIEDTDLMPRLSELIATLEDKPAEPFMDCVRRLAERRMKSESEQLLNRIRQAERAGDASELKRLFQEQYEIRRKMQMLGRNS